MNTARPPLKSLDAALAELLAQALPIPDVEEVDTFEADGRVLARDLVSELQVPPHDNSAMDGYALRGADVAAAGTTLRVGQRIPAGAVADQPLASGEAARIFTGAQLPPGADAVVMQEDCQSLEDGQVRVNVLPRPGQNVRRAGEDVRLGTTVLPQGARLNPAALGLAASIGLDRLPVVRRPRVALFSTGDELVMPGAVAPAQLPPGAIYNSNRFFLRALLQRLGCVVTDCGIVPDQREATIAALREAAEGNDLILSSGGVSVGEEDHVKPAVLALGSLVLWQLAIKPGKPFAYGKLRGAQGLAHFIGLPGNPVSSYVTFLLLVRPFLLRLQGMPAQALAPTVVTLPAHFEWTRGEKRREFLRARRNAAGGVDLHPQQGSGVLTSVAWGDGLVDNPPERRIARGDPVQFIAFSEFMV
jgi:molybdopterin molybdotransferase